MPSTTTAERNGWTFSQTPIWMTCDDRISDHAHRLLVYLLWRQGKDDSCWPSLGRMARDLRVSRETIRRRLRELERAGYLVTRHRQGTSSRYTVMLDPGGAADEYMPAPNGKMTDPPAESRGGRPGPGGPSSEGGDASRPREPSLGPEGRPSSRPRGTPVRVEGHDDRNGREKGDGERKDREKRDRLAAVWPSVLANLKLQMTQAAFDLWFTGATARLEDDGLVIGLPSRRAVEAVSHRLHGVVVRTARRVLGEEGLSVACEVRDG